MHSRGSSATWQNRRKPSIGPVRRAHPASGATWNVQIVRGKITSRCLWHACRALAIGIVLMTVGAGMATVGYYADELSIGKELRGNSTVRVKNESKGFHLNNLSYAGPIVMGVGGFIIVAACVMTFEARDSAAKVVPARFKLSTTQRSSSNSKARGTSSIRTRGIGSARWNHHFGVFRTSPGCETVSPAALDRQAQTAAFVHFSKAIGSPSRRRSPKQRRLSRSDSVPNLSVDKRLHHSLNMGSPRIHRNHHHHHHHRHNYHYHNRSPRHSNASCRSTTSNDSRLLHPGLIHLHRQALSVDESGPNILYPGELMNGSKGSIPVDVHSNDSHERFRRSEMAKRHILARQRPIDKEEVHHGAAYNHEMRRRSSTTSDASTSMRAIGRRRTSSMSRAPSVDSRMVANETSSFLFEENLMYSADMAGYFSSPSHTRRHFMAQNSTPSTEFRSQLSVSSDPMAARQLSYQSSIEPCVPEESPEQEERDALQEDLPAPNLTPSISSPVADIIPQTTFTPRPETLNIQSNIILKPQKLLYRSSSTRSFKKPKPKIKLDQIYFIGNNQTDDDNYNSIDVIDERRRKNFSRNNSAINSSECTTNNNNSECISSVDVKETGAAQTKELDPLDEREDATEAVNEGDASVHPVLDENDMEKV